MADSKKTYVFSVSVELGAAPEQHVTLDAERQLRPELDRLIDACVAKTTGWGDEPLGYRRAMAKTIRLSR